MTKDELIELQRKAEAAANAFNCWAAANTYGKTAAELVEIDIGFRRAETAWLHAYAAYQAALREFV